jgi:hypothetical protein
MFFSNVYLVVKFFVHLCKAICLSLFGGNSRIIGLGGQGRAQQQVGQAAAQLLGCGLRIALAQPAEGQGAHGLVRC